MKFVTSVTGERIALAELIGGPHDGGYVPIPHGGPIQLELGASQFGDKRRAIYARFRSGDGFAYQFITVER